MIFPSVDGSSKSGSLFPYGSNNKSVGSGTVLMNEQKWRRKLQATIPIHDGGSCFSHYSQ